jgi:acid phosphatase
MNLKRRRFLILSSLGILSAGGLLKLKGISSNQSDNFNLANAATATSDPIFRFVAVGDTGTGQAGQYGVAKAMTRYYQQHPFNFILLAGDNIYPNGEIERIEEVFEKPYEPLLEKGVKFYAALGNHDIRTNNGEDELKYPAFNLSDRYYTFRQGPIQFFALDTNHNANWKAQLPWLDKELSRSEAPWKIVFGHHHIYASGVRGVNQLFVDNLTPILEKHGVQFYLNGHEHHYERTRPINGITYLTCGAGALLRPVRKSEWTEYSTSNLSFAAFDVYEDSIVVSGINTNNQVFDRGIIQ